MIDLELIGTSPEYLLVSDRHLSTRFYISPKTVGLVVFKTTARKFSTLNFYLPPDVEIRLEPGPLQSSHYSTVASNKNKNKKRYKTTTSIAVEVNVLPLTTLTIESYANGRLDTKDECASFQVQEFKKDEKIIREISTKSLYYNSKGFVYPITASHDEFDW
jgi:hypothetical protein